MVESGTFGARAREHRLFPGYADSQAARRAIYAAGLDAVMHRQVLEAEQDMTERSLRIAADLGNVMDLTKRPLGRG